MTNYLFSAGTARGGTGLMAHMLSVHPKVKVVSDPVLALYKAFRNSAVSQSGDAIKEHFDLESPLGDYYFTDDRRRILDLIGSSDLNVEFDQKEWPNLKATLKKRALLASADIVPHIDALSGATYREIFENCLAMLKRVRSGGADLDWIGIHENWTIEFFLPLARAFPSAKFAVVIRDPRAVITSNFREKDKSRIGHLVSYARCHRKLIACASYFETLPLFKDRLFVLRYEDMLLNPSDKCKSLCDFLNVQFIEDMLDTTKYINHATGGVHDGLSNYEENAQGFNPARIGRWKEHLSPNRANLIDFLCGPEMALFGYEAVNIKPLDPPPAECLNTLIEEMSGYKAWRCDFQDPIQDYGFELFRRELLKRRFESSTVNENVLRRCFLFPEVFSKLSECLSSSRV